MPEPARVDVTVWHLALDGLRPAAPPPAGARIERAAVPLGALNRFFYTEIGRDFAWVDRLAWSAERWQGYAESVETWVAYDRGTPAGYAEVRAHATTRAAIEMFGLLAPFRGRGLGGALLTRAAERARELRPEVVVDTCSLDGPHALRNYERRGFRVVRETHERRAADLLP